MPAANSAVIARQCDALHTMARRHVGPGSAYALLDYPNHSNVGDCAIWLGEIALLQGITGNAPAYVCEHHDFDAEALRRAFPEGPVFLHGGGNLGDIWPKHQRFREMILERLPDREIVQLPQSIAFREERGIAGFANLLSAHRDAHLYVRDRRSLDFAEARLGVAATLVPDCAFAMGALARRGVPAVDILMLMRTDSERAGHDQHAAPATGKIEVVDWLEEPRQAGDRWMRRARRLADRLGTSDAMTRRRRQYDRKAAERLERGLALLSRGRQVVTDRLHGHILSTLLDIPHVALDNSYGKVSGYIAAWTREFPHLRTAATPDEALARLAELP
ncbi:polysaccharide pyruvyl transferase family protein [Stakelama saccharophila]|uniref:Polysaccharide pyruvyl transferase family protein n=1 Tax=Stakelama saccharophila TaxID=3075605 RepID=A0ABZ0BAS3_9SPHN|nr:polysaccharide pyruvyl transferase family protein [Stakelama sp. W311]WNO54517.1 polysaccharide pyruvyl transferase family protein [Stakelama sp. W311]